MYMCSKRITPERGKIYKNKGGGKFLCIRSCNNNAVMQNVASKWTFNANGVVQYADGTIEWDYSTGGHFKHFAEGNCRMLRTDEKTNNLLARVIEKFCFHYKQIESESAIVADAAKKMVEIDLWEMWVLTQK